MLQHFGYWITATLPSNIFILLMVEDLCGRTLPAIDERRSSTPYLLTAAAVLMTAADLFRSGLLTMLVCLAVLIFITLWRYERERPFIRLAAVLLFELLISAADISGQLLCRLGHPAAPDRGSPLLSSSIAGQIFLLVIFLLMRWYIRAAVGVFHSGRSTWFWVCLIVPAVSLPSMLVFWRLSMTGDFTDGTELIFMLCCTALLFGCHASFTLFENIAVQMEVTREYQAIRLRQEMEKRHYDLLQQRSDRYASFVHDMKHHLRTLRQLTDAGDSDALREYIDGLQLQLQRLNGGGNVRIFTEDRILNVILSEKARLAADEEISFSADLTASLDFLDPMETCALMGNLLDNALEGAETTPSGREKFVRLQIRPFNQGFVLIRAENSFSGFLREKNGRLLSTKDAGQRGYGMRSIAQIAEKTGGSMEYESRDGIFTVTVLLNVVLSEEE
jgi:hypothetical protein